MTMPPGWPPPGPPPGWQPGPPPGWPPQPPPKRGSKTNLVIGLVAGAVALVIVVVFVAIVTTTVSEDPGPVTDEQRAANAKVAQTTSEFETVCERGSIANAAAYRKPYTFVTFSESGTGMWHEMSLMKLDQNASPVPTSVNLVACLAVKPGSEVRSGSCEFRSNGRDVEVDRYAVEYELRVHEARSGRLVTSLGTVKGPATSCPVVEYFGSGDRKIYGDPDDVVVTQKLEAFAAG
ncbi:hypothetical protein [Mycobacterium sp. GA-2829]|uniref:hypothetical protein n=1 Tax=Mycobacterium sp. GA-2829 TaxID=1772283 RepID=UPI000ADDF426|nr:hypothetical protein [Mycobacterium sp. GA-2829]